jgi:hypothetical protein
VKAAVWALQSAGLAILESLDQGGGTPLSIFPSENFPFPHKRNCGASSRWFEP